MFPPEPPSCATIASNWHCGSAGLSVMVRKLTTEASVGPRDHTGECARHPLERMANKCGDHDENARQHEPDAKVIQDADEENSVWANVTLWMRSELAPRHPQFPRRHVALAPGEGGQRPAESHHEPGQPQTKDQESHGFFRHTLLSRSRSASR